MNAASLRLLTPTKLKAFIAGLTKEEVTALDNDWSLWARPEQLPPGTDWSLWIMLGGRGSGKTRAGAEWVRMQMEGTTPLSAGAASRCALVADTIRDAREVMVEGVSGILSLSSMRKDMRPVHEPSRQRMVWPNGAIAQYYSAEDPDSLRGAQFSHAWLDEFCKWRQAEDAWDMLQFGLRLGARPRQVITSTPRPLKLLKKLMAREDAVTTMMRTLDNRANLPPSFFNQIVKQYEGTRLGHQELEGEILEDNVNGLWQREQIEHCRALDRPQLRRIIVAVDPAVTSGKSSDECGIIVAGIDVQDQIYVLADRSIARAKPTVLYRPCLS